MFVTNTANNKKDIEDELIESVGKPKEELSAPQKKLLKKAVDGIWSEIENGMPVSFAIAMHPDTHVFLDECRDGIIKNRIGLNREEKNKIIKKFKDNNFLKEI